MTLNISINRHKKKSKHQLFTLSKKRIQETTKRAMLTDPNKYNYRNDENVENFSFTYDCHLLASSTEKEYEVHFFIKS